MNKRLEKKKLKQKQIAFLWSIVGSEKRWYIAYFLNQMTPSFQSLFLKSTKLQKSRRTIKNDILTHYREDEVVPASIHYKYLESPKFLTEWAYVEKERRKVSDENLMVRTMALTNVCIQIDAMKRKLFDL